MITIEEMLSRDQEPDISTEELCKALCKWIETHPGQMIMVREGFNYITGEPHYSAEVIEYGEWTPTIEKERVMNAYKQGREDGYDEACMDLTDNDLGSSLEEEGKNCGECFGASFNDCDECRGLVPDPDCQWT